jgi:RNA polymerase sigma factor (sigma-70 family)
VFARLLAEHRRGKTYGGVPYRVVVNQVITYTIRDHFEPRPTDVPLPEDWEPAAPPDGAHERVELEELLAGLPDGDRRAGVLRYLHGLDPETIARMLSTTRNAVDQALFRCRARLREVYGDG